MKIKRKIIFSDFELPEENLSEFDSQIDSVHQAFVESQEKEEKTSIEKETEFFDETVVQNNNFEEASEVERYRLYLERRENDKERLKRKIAELANSNSESNGPICVVEFTSPSTVDDILHKLEDEKVLYSWQVINKKDYYQMVRHSFTNYFFIALYSYLKYLLKKYCSGQRDNIKKIIKKENKELKRSIRAVQREIKYSSESLYGYGLYTRRNNTPKNMIDIFNIFNIIWDYLDHIQTLATTLTTNTLFGFKNRKLIIHLTNGGVYDDSLYSIFETISFFTNTNLVIIMSINEDHEDLDKTVQFQMNNHPDIDIQPNADSFLNNYTTPDKIFYLG